jgi:protein-L-isoaspartate(D-aspartate) O-methyltransferase
MEFHKTAEFEKDLIREPLKLLGEKDKKTKLPKKRVESHREMIALLTGAVLEIYEQNREEINPRALEAIEKMPRTEFFDWKDVPDYVKEKVLTPYTFMSPTFAEEQSITSPHLALSHASFLDLHDNQKILEVGTGSGYTAYVLAYTAGKGSRVYSVEIRPRLVEKSRENIKKAGMQDSVEIIQARQGVLGLPEESPFDRIYCILAAKRTSQVEELTEQLREGGKMLLSIAKYPNTPEKEESMLWYPGKEIGDDEIYFGDPSRGLARIAIFTFRREDKNNVTYSATVSNVLGNLLE